MSHVLIVPANRVADARRLMWALGQQHEDGQSFSIELDGYYASHSWVELLPDTLPATDWQAFGLTEAEAIEIAGVIAQDSGTWGETRFLTALEQARVAKPWVQPIAGADPGYPVDAVRTWDGVAYRNTVADNFFRPDALNGGWVIAWAPDEEPDWAPDTQYLAGRIVRGNDRRWQAKIAEFSGVGREPWNPVMWAVWGDLGLIDGGEPEPDEWPAWVQPTGGHDAYPMGAKVTHNGRRWENTGSAANVWAPGVFGWEDRGPAP